MSQIGATNGPNVRSPTSWKLGNTGLDVLAIALAA